MPKKQLEIEIDGHTVTITNPDKIFYPALGKTKLDVVRYFQKVAPGAVRGVRNRPMILKRFVDGAEGEPFYQKRAPDKVPEFVKICTIYFPSGRSANEVVCDNGACLLWVANLGCLDLNPWPVRAEDTDHPDELRVDLDPTPEASWDMVRQVALVARDVLRDHGLTGWPKTSGNRGIHINVRIQPVWNFTLVRRAALALAREVERRAPDLATSAWWKEQRRGVFVDFNQNARDRTVASAYSLRPTKDARVSTPLFWEEVAEVDPAAFTIDTVPARFSKLGDPGEGIDEAVGSLDGLLDLSKRDEAGGLGDAPWPPHFPKGDGEPARVQPSRKRKT
ncbi:MAG: DNA polymerase domain-containing protein [Candidatus Eremiobacteraeota bacterium]|nr:DNA polymerase domain-containing protein [Candidatus Eremiobacteraeota bacterium]MCW5865946.1 DNA polymerase domain-containing protein [Candidatus Eremiobacteraeota bacterium]